MNYEPNTIDEYFDLLQEVDGLDVQIVQVRKDYSVLQVNASDPKAMRKELVRVIGPKLGIDFLAPRKTKKDGYTLEIPTYVDDDQDEEGEPIVVRIKKGGNHRAGRLNELDFQQFIKSEIADAGICHLDISDNYGVRVKLDIVEVIDASASHGTNGEQNRSDTTVRLTDGTLYGISHKKTNATYVCKARKMFHDIMFQCGQKLRAYAKEHGMQRGDYMDVRITNRELIDLCWFGTDISTGAVFIGDFENMSSGEQHIERIIRNGDEDVLTSFPIYTKWLIVNNAYTMKFCGVSVASKGGKWIVDDVEVPGVNAPMPNGKKFNVGQEEPKKRRHKRHKRRVTEDLMSEEQMMEEARQNDLWDTVAFCAENHKLVWLKYETVDEGEIISRKVAPYSYRTRDTKVRGRSTYFYGEDYTPGEDHTIKCFLIENCLDAKESKQSFTPRHPIEIKMEIDKLEQKRKEDELKKQKKDNDKEEQPTTPEKDRKDNDEIVDEPKVQNKPSKVQDKPKPVKKPEPKKVEQPSKPQPSKKPEPEKKPEPKPQPSKSDQEKEEQKRKDGTVKVDSEPDTGKEEPSKPVAKPDASNHEEPSSDNSVTLDDDGREHEEGDVKITDGDGNTIED